MKKIILALSLMVSSAAMAVCNQIVPGQQTAAMLNAAIAGPCITSGTIQGSIISNTPISGSTGSFTTLAATVGYTGVASSAAAAAGTLGEYASFSVAAATTGLTSGSAVNVTSVLLQPGDYDVEASYIIKGSGSTYFTFAQAGINTTSATLPNDNITNVRNSASFLPTNAIYAAACVPSRQILVPAGTTQTVYLVAFSTFSASTAGVGGTIRYRRAR